MEPKGETGEIGLGLGLGLGLGGMMCAVRQEIGLGLGLGMMEPAGR
jgi:hypothetical protein